MRSWGEYFSSLLSINKFCEDEETVKKEEKIEKEEKEEIKTSSSYSDLLSYWFSKKESVVKEESLDGKEDNEDTFKLIDVFDKPEDENVNELFKTNF